MTSPATVRVAVTGSGGGVGVGAGVGVGVGSGAADASGEGETASNVPSVEGHPVNRSKTSKKGSSFRIGSTSFPWMKHIITVLP